MVVVVVVVMCTRLACSISKIDSQNPRSKGLGGLTFHGTIKKIGRVGGGGAWVAQPFAGE